MEDRLCLQVIIGVTEHGRKELVAVEDGHRESEGTAAHGRRRWRWSTRSGVGAEELEAGQGISSAGLRGQQREVQGRRASTGSIRQERGLMPIHQI